MNLEVKNWIINASPIISLSRIDSLDIIKEIYPEFIVPVGVYEEIMAYKYEDKAKEWCSHLLDSHFFKTEISPLIASWDLGKGESEVLSLAYKYKNSGVVLDDKLARNCAKVYNFPLHGTIGLIIRAKQLSVVGDLKYHLYKLKKSGFRISETVINKAIEISEGNKI